MAKRFIPGIFNYCDYWCERCPFTRRCRNFTMGRELEREAQGDKPVDDATNQDFWNQLAHQLQEASMKGRAGEWMDDFEVDFDEPPDPVIEKKMHDRKKAVEESELVRMAHTYMDKAGAWLKTADGDLKDVARDLLEAAGKKFAADDYEEEALQIGEMIEVIAWYHTLFPPKIARAVGGLVGLDDPDDEMSDVLAESRNDDANGSAKIVLVGIERSAAAWVRMREILPRREDEILEMLALLSRLQRGIHAALPGAKSFIRPGFDEKPGIA